MNRQTIGTVLIAILSAAVVVAFFFFEPIPQDPAYHSFSDTETMLSIPNALNVLSNVPFLIVGLMGLLALARARDGFVTILASNHWAYVTLFLGAGLVGFGSGYYHLWPNNETLVWDRMPMTIAFMGFFSIIISEYVSEYWGRRLLIPLLIIGIGSVVYWWVTESQGAGDLRYYAVVQFFPILCIPIMLLCYSPRYTHVSGYWLLLATYAAAKLFETFDSQIHSTLVVISGHSIKHVFPAIGLYLLIRSYRQRTQVLETNPED